MDSPVLRLGGILAACTNVFHLSCHIKLELHQISINKNCSKKKTKQRFIVPFRSLRVLWSASEKARSLTSCHLLDGINVIRKSVVHIQVNCY